VIVQNTRVRDYIRSSTGHVVRYAEDDSNRPIGLFFTFLWCQIFGQRTASPTEASHRDVTSYLVNGNSTLYRLIEVIELMLQKKQAAFEATIATQKVQMRQAVFQQQWLGTML